MCNLLLRLQILFTIYSKMRIRNFTKIGEGLQCCRSPPGEDLQWKGEDLQCFRSSGGRSARGKVCNVSDLPGEGLQGGRSAMFQIFRGKVCNVADLPRGRSAIQHWFIQPVSILLTKLLTHIKQSHQNYCGTAHSRSGINQMWILKNSKDLLEHLKSPSFNQQASILSIFHTV